MLKTASWMAMLLIAASAGGASAADCLQQVDGITVQYDLPASEAIAGTQTGRYPKAPPMTEGGMRAAPAGRPGARSAEGLAQPTPSPAPAPGTTAAGTPLRQTPALPVENRLTPAQRTRLQTVLHDARAADALGHEAQCLDLLHQAQAITGKHG